MEYKVCISKSSLKNKNYKDLKFQIKLLCIINIYPDKTECIQSCEKTLNMIAKKLSVEETWFRNIIIEKYNCFLINDNMFFASKKKAKRTADFLEALALKKQLNGAG